MNFSWSWSKVWNELPQLLTGLKVTVIATLLIFVVAVLLGFVFALLKRSPNRLVSIPANVATEFVRRTPELVQLYFIFYVLPTLGLTLAALTSGVIGLGLHYSTYMSEIYRGGIDSLPRGQWDAATALNMPAWRKWRTVILPQAVPRVLPSMGSLLILMFKQTALLSAITVQELLAQAQAIGSETFDYVEPIITAGVLYFIISYLASIGVRRLEKRVAHA